MTGPSPSRPITHVGLTVSDLDAAIDWYESTLEFETVAGPFLQEGDADATAHLRDLLGTEIERVRMAFMASDGEVDLELFEFGDSTGVSETQPSDIGFFHVGVIDPDLRGLAERIDETGGEHYSDVWELYPGFEATYCYDPWRNRIEIYNQSLDHEQL